MKTNLKRSSVKHAGAGSRLTPRHLAGLAGGLAAAALLGACSDSTTPPTPEETRLAWREGVTLYESGDFEGASSRLQIAATGSPDDPYVQYLFGLSLWKSGHLEESEAALLRSSGIHGGSVRTWTNLARVRIDRGNPEGALEALNRGDEALATLQHARQADPGNGYIANTLGYLWLRRGRTDEAVAQLEAARDTLPGVSYVRNNLGVAYERRGEIDKAVAEFQAAVESGDSDGKASASLARLEPVVERLMAGRQQQEQEQPPVAQNTTDDSSRQK